MTNYLIVTNLNVISHQGFSMLQTTCTASDKTHKPLAVRVRFSSGSAYKSHSLLIILVILPVFRVKRK